jgi:putative lipoprotein
MTMATSLPAALPAALAALRSRVRTVICAAMLCAAALLLTACAAAQKTETPAPDNLGTVSGTVLYRERIILPPDAELTVRLLDVSRADAPAQALGVQTMALAGPPPYAFRVAAEIRSGGRLLFITDTRHAVLTRGAAGTAQLVLKAVGP